MPGIKDWHLSPNFFNEQSWNNDCLSLFCVEIVLQSVLTQTLCSVNVIVIQNSSSFLGLYLYAENSQVSFSCLWSLCYLRPSTVCFQQSVLPLAEDKTRFVSLLNPAERAGAVPSVRTAADTWGHHCPCQHTLNSCMWLWKYGCTFFSAGFPSQGKVSKGRARNINGL